MLDVWIEALAVVSILLLAVPVVRVAAPLPFAAFATYMACWVGAHMALPSTALGALIAVSGFAFGLAGVAAGAWLLALVAWATSYCVDRPRKACFRHIALRSALTPVLFVVATAETAGIVH
jgi:hypothetical protein